MRERNVRVFLFLALTLMCVVLACSMLSGTAFASNLPSSMEVPQETGEEAVLQDEVSSGEDDMETVKTVSGTGLVFEPMEEDELGTASLSDIYNVLVNIYNLGLMIFIVALMIWTYHMITKSFRRFIY